MNDMDATYGNLLEFYRECRADVEFLAWCFENAPEEMANLVYKYNKEGKLFEEEEE